MQIKDRDSENIQQKDACFLRKLWHGRSIRVFKKSLMKYFWNFFQDLIKGLVTEKGLSEGLKDEGIVRGENEIKEMIGKNKPDKITEEILFSKKDYVSQYKVLKNPEPKMGCKVEDLGSR